MNYKTSDLAKHIKVHPNTIRFYEEMGFLTIPLRKKNNYRLYSEVQLYECEFIKLALKSEVLQNGLREHVITMIRSLAKLDINTVESDLTTYEEKLKKEIINCNKAIYDVTKIFAKEKTLNLLSLNHAETSKYLGISKETIRTWERSGLITVKHHKNGYKYYDEEAINRLNIIKILRLANYSLSSILRLLNNLENHNENEIMTIIDTPLQDEDIISVCDHLITCLKQTVLDVDNMRILLKKINSTIQ